MDYSLLHRQYRDLLLDGIVPFWTNHIDHEHGGLLTCITEEGERISTDKYVWSQARWVWVCAALYNRVDPQPRFLEWARATIEFLCRHGRDARGRWAYALTREGKVVEGATSIYSDCFFVYGISEYLRAVPDSKLRELALTTFDLIRDRVEQPDFAETAPYRLPPNRRNHGVPMILTEVSNELAVTTGLPGIEAAAAEYASRVLDHFVRPERQAVIEFLDRDYNEVPGPEGTFVMPGHAIESMWFILHWARRTGRTDLFGRAAEVIRWHLEKSWDPEHGGIFLGLDAEGGEPFQPHSDYKIWWPHTEALYALLLCRRLIGGSEWEKWYERVHQWSFEHFPMPGFGEWRQRLDREGRPVTAVVALPVKDPFHLPRACILACQLLEQA